jgi:predicted PurR-regulated permease PerM
MIKNKIIIIISLIILFNLCIINAATTLDELIGDDNTIRLIINKSHTNESGIILLKEIPIPTPNFHGENVTSFVHPINKSNNTFMSKVKDNIYTTILFIIFIILIISIIFYLIYKYYNNEEIIGFDKDFGGFAVIEK